MVWVVFKPGLDLGLLPGLLSEDDPRPASEQIDANYAYGGGWDPMPGFKLLSNYVLAYPGDPSMRPIAGTALRHERIFLYPHDFLGVFQPDGSFEVSRVD